MEVKGELFCTRMNQNYSIVRKKILIKLIFLLTGFYFGFLQTGRAQDVSMHTQGVMQQEFINPAYNSFKSYISLSAYSRAQWTNKFENSPETYLLNVYLPIKLSRFGVNVQSISESIGLRKTIEMKLSICNNIQLSRNAFLSFGYSLGFMQNSFVWEKVISYPDVDIGSLIGQGNLDAVYPTVSLGTLLLTKNWFVGISSMTTNISSNMDDSQYLPGFDLSCGAIVPLSSWLLMRPGLLVKYYKEKGYKSSGGVLSSYQIPTVFDVSANFLIGNKIWFGGSYRFDQAITFSTDLIIRSNIKLGYTYEFGIGKGLNSIGSHGIRLAYSLRSKQEGNRNNGMNLWMNHRMSQRSIASYIY